MSYFADYSLELTFRGPLISQATGTLAMGVDTAMRRYQNTPVLTGSLIRGNIRHVLGQYADLSKEISDSRLDSLNACIPVWFGHASDTESFTTQRASIHFDFFWRLINPSAFEKSQNGDSDKKRPVAQRTRIQIEEKSGKVVDGALQVIEDYFPSGIENPVFSGRITGIFKTSGDARIFEYWIARALDYIPALGSFKGTGFGKLESWQLTPIKTKKSRPKHPQLPNNSTRFGIVLDLDRPFCVGRPATEDSNRIVSEDYLSGNIIKGVIAKQFYYHASKDRIDTDRLQKELCFDELVISHALPVEKNIRPKPIALSLAWLGDELIDMAGLDQKPKNIIWTKIPSFQPDWKDQQWKRAKMQINASSRSPQRYLTVRTEINAKGVAREHRLFTLDCIDPKGFTWCADIELKNIPEEKRAAVFSKLINLFTSDLIGIGKTKARASITYQDSYAPFKPSVVKSSISQNKQLTITLTTAARLLPQDLDIENVNDYCNLKKAYQNYWSNLNPDYTLERFFAKQSLTGAYYHQVQNGDSGAPYQPEWLTIAGSVFVLTVDSAEAEQQLKEYGQTGLPAHINTDGQPPIWRDTPFLPENGYGEIEINPPEQMQRQFQGERSS